MSGRVPGAATTTGGSPPGTRSWRRRGAGRRRRARSASAASGSPRRVPGTPTPGWSPWPRWGGLSPAEVVDLLRRYSRQEVPANVLQTLAGWAARVEGLVLRGGVTLLGFAGPAERDRYLAEHPGGSPCGDRFVLASGPKAARPP